MESANRQISAARAYHDVTRHSYASVRTDGHVLDWDNKPFPFKIYPQVSGLPLPRNLALSTMPTLAALGPQAAEPREKLDLERLTRILYCAAGLTHHRHVGAEDYHFRAASSAGALYPIELYVACGADLAEVLPAGLYHFSPADLKLRGLRPGDYRQFVAQACAMRPAVAHAQTIVILSAIFWRSAWKYRARCYRYCWWDAGTMLANLTAAARADGCRAEVIANFVDTDMERLLGVDGEHEAPMCIVALGRDDSAAAEPPEVEPLNLETVPISQQERAYPDLITMHRTSKLASAQEVAELAKPAAEMAAEGRPNPADSGAGTGHPLGWTIRSRGSTRIFAREEITRAELEAMMAASNRRPACDFPELVDTYLIINAVSGMAPGAYYYEARSGGFELLKDGEFRDQAGYLCLEQALGADASALVIYMADFDHILVTMGNRGYRAAQLEAGIRGGELYLAAYSLDRGASGLTFYDEDTTDFLSPHASGKIALLMVAVGVPA